jgi:peptidoglycan/LPS O-acetylase OafA/YrhL
MQNIARYYRPELDVLRLAAFLLVFCNHRNDVARVSPDYPVMAALAGIGIFGVPVFFLLSAFLITELLNRELESVGTVHVKAFYVRRILRIWPLYYAVFYALVLLNHVLRRVGASTAGSIAAFSLFSGNWYVFGHGWLASPVSPLWSVSVEEQFYVAIPLLTYFFRARGLKIVNITLIGVAYPFIVYYATHKTHGYTQWTNSFVQFQFFAAGSLLSVYLRGRLPKLHWLLRWLFAAAALGGYYFANHVLGVDADHPHATLSGALVGWTLVLGCTILLFLSLYGVAAKYMPRVLVYFGRISYGLYMVHAFFLYCIFRLWTVGLTELSTTLHLADWKDALGTVLAIVATSLLAMLSYHLYEKPFLRLKRRFTFVPSRD